MIFIFFISIIVLILFAVLKFFEIKRSDFIVARNVRMRLDVYVESFSAKCHNVCHYTNIKRLIVMIYGTVTHVFARLIANVASATERYARYIAHRGARIKHRTRKSLKKHKEDKKK